MDRQLLMKINRTAFEVGVNTKHDVYVSYFTKTNAVEVNIYRGGFSFGSPEVLSSLFVDGQVILHTLLALLNEKEDAA